MAEEVSLEETTNVRPRKACLKCYERKVKCDFDPGSSSCRSCKKNGFDCIISDGDPAKPRRSIRSTVEDLESRLQFLEGRENPWPAVSTMSQPQPGNFAPSPPRLSTGPRNGAAVVESSSDRFLTPVSRGTTSPWSILLTGTENSSSDLRNFQETTLRNADDESSVAISNEIIYYDLLSEVPGLNPVDVEKSAQNYARSAPFPILRWASLEVITQSLIEQKHAKRLGQVACLWIYMAFGAAHGGETMADISTDRKSGLYFQKAWEKLPQLLLDYDIWALKAITLMVHYLQATAKPQACWALLGTALRLALSLGFDRDEAFLTKYSQVEREEGRRAFWLCYIMEKSLCINLGYGSSFPLASRAPKPSPFVLESSNGQDILDTNDYAAARFFGQMIDLTEMREKLLLALSSDERDQDDSYKLLLSDLEQSVAPGNFAQAASIEDIRASIRELAYSNTYQIFQITKRHAYGGQISRQAVLSARRSLDLISECQRSGQLMCIWMWLYYAFTSAVTVFLDSIANPLGPETGINLVAISDLKSTCGGLLEVSEGAARCMEIANSMGATINKIIKLAGRKRAVEETGDESFKIRRIEPGASTTLTNSDREQVARQNSPSEEVDALLTGLPSNIAWDEWDEWLKDTNS